MKKYTFKVGDKIVLLPYNLAIITKHSSKRAKDGIHISEHMEAFFGKEQVVSSGSTSRYFRLRGCVDKNTYYHWIFEDWMVSNVNFNIITK